MSSSLAPLCCRDKKKDDKGEDKDEKVGGDRLR